MSRRVQIDGIGFDPLTQAEVIEKVTHFLDKPRRAKAYRIVKPYVEFFEPARDDEAVGQALNQADLVVADSVAIQWASAWLIEPRPTFARFVWSLAVGLRKPAWLSQVIPERGEGASATHLMLLAAAQHGWKVGILGGPADIDATRESIMERYPLLQLEGVWSGYFESSAEPDLVRTITRAKVDLLFVAMGFPRQELFMARHVSSRIARVMLGEGGTFDYDEMGGQHRRAPQWMRQSGLEWLWRLMLQPWRLGRQLAIPRFMWRIFLQSRRTTKVS